MRTLVALAALGLAFAALACGGGSSGSVSYAPTVVQITHIDFTGVELTVADLTNPPSSFVDHYPDEVATVNGQPVTSEALAYSEIAIEFHRRQEDAANVLHLPTPVRTVVRDPLQVAIDNELKRQAIVRLNLLASREEAQDLARTQEAVTLHSTVTPNAQERAMLREEGFPENDWAADAALVEKYRYVLADMKFRQEYCPSEAEPTIGVDYTPPDPRTRAAEPRSSRCDDFLARERKNAKIVYYVRWAD